MDTEEFAKRMRALARYRDLSVDLPSVSVPTLVLYGENELPFVVRHTAALAAGLPAVEGDAAPDAGHASNLDNPEYFTDAVAGFLADVYRDESGDEDGGAVDASADADATLDRTSTSVRPETVDPVGDLGVVVPKPVGIGLAADVDDVDLAAPVRVDVLEVVDGADDVDGRGDVVAVGQTVHLPVDVVLDETVYRLGAVQSVGERLDARFEIRLQQSDTVFDACRLRPAVGVAGQRVVGRRDGATARVADDDRGLGPCVGDRVEHVPGDGLAVGGPLDDPVPDVADREQVARLVVPPHPVLQDPRVRTADGDRVGVLCVLYVVETVGELGRMVGVALQHLGERLVHS
jgi:hypothetical protein